MLNRLRKIISPENPIRLAWHKFKAMTASVLYRFPAKRLVCIGVTGTNGKTTTTHMIEHLLSANGKKAAMMSTVEFRLNGVAEPNLSKKTTMSPFKTQMFLRRCVQQKVDYVVIESSSHALHQNRLWGIPFSISALTNITHEHLDYHKTMEKYRDAKKILFKNTSETCQRSESGVLKKIPHQQAMILNAEDRFFEDFNKIKCPAKYTYGFKAGIIQAHQVSTSKSGSESKLEYDGNEKTLKLNIPGSFNIENAMASIAVAMACRISFEKAVAGLESFSGVSGRMESIKSPKGFEVIVDFALTPDALEKLYASLKNSGASRLIGIIGSAGDRDQEKRPVMGEIVAKHTDFTIVTDEEPYSEDPIAIMQAVMQGAKKKKQEGKDLFLIEDRFAAIEFAVSKAQAGDLIILTGMGSLPTRTLNSGPVEWDEREIVRKIINNQR